MRMQIHPVFATLLILGVLGAIGYVFWKANLDKPIPDGPGGGRIGMTYTLKPGPPGPDGVSKPQFEKPKTTKLPEGAKPSK